MPRYEVIQRTIFRQQLARRNGPDTVISDSEQRRRIETRKKGWNDSRVGEVSFYRLDAQCVRGGLSKDNRKAGEREEPSGKHPGYNDAKRLKRCGSVEEASWEV